MERGFFEKDSCKAPGDILYCLSQSSSLEIGKKDIKRNTQKPME